MSRAKQRWVSPDGQRQGSAALALVMGVLALAAAAPSPAATKGAESEGKQPYVAVEVRGPGAARPMTLVLREGATGYYADAREGVSVAILAADVGTESGTAEFIVFDATLDQAAGQLLLGEEQGGLFVLLGQEGFVGLSGGALEVRPTQFGSSLESMGIGRSSCVPWPSGGLMDRCCLGCGPTSACGCSVEGPCGSCTGTCFAGP